MNPNTSASVTVTMVEIARGAAPPELEFEGITAEAGVPLITEPNALATAADAVIALAPRLASFDAIIVAAFSDPGRAQLARMLPLVPVVGIGEASMAQAASLSGGRFSVATTTPALKASIRQLAASCGYADALTSVRTPVGDALMLMANEHATEEALYGLCQSAVSADGARAVIIGGGPLGRAARALSPRLSPCPIIEPIPAAVATVARQLQQGVGGLGPLPAWALGGGSFTSRLRAEAMFTPRFIRRESSGWPPPPWCTLSISLVQAMPLSLLLPPSLLLKSLLPWVAAFYLLPRPVPQLSPMLLLCIGASYLALSVKGWTGWALPLMAVPLGFVMNLVEAGMWDSLEPLLVRCSPRWLLVRIRSL